MIIDIYTINISLGWNHNDPVSHDDKRTVYDKKIHEQMNKILLDNLVLARFKEALLKRVPVLYARRGKRLRCLRKWLLLRSISVHFTLTLDWIVCQGIHIHMLHKDIRFSNGLQIGFHEYLLYQDLEEEIFKNFTTQFLYTYTYYVMVVINILLFTRKEMEKVFYCSGG